MSLGVRASGAGGHFTVALEGGLPSYDHRDGLNLRRSGLVCRASDHAAALAGGRGAAGSGGVRGDRGDRDPGARSRPLRCDPRRGLLEALDRDRRGTLALRRSERPARGAQRAHRARGYGDRRQSRLQARRPPSPPGPGRSAACTTGADAQLALVSLGTQRRGVRLRDRSRRRAARCGDPAACACDGRRLLARPHRRSLPRRRDRRGAQRGDAGTAHQPCSATGRGERSEAQRVVCARLSGIVILLLFGI